MKYEKYKNNPNTSSHSAVNIYQWLIKSLQQPSQVRGASHFIDKETEASE